MTCRPELARKSRHRKDRPWWDHITLVHIMAHAEEFRDAQAFSRKWAMRHRIEAMGRLLKNLRFVHQRNEAEGKTTT